MVLNPPTKAFSLGAVTVDKVCTACKGRNTKVLALTPDNMKQNRKLAILFRAPEDIIREAYEDMRMAIEFQNKNLNNLVAGMGMICQKAKDESNQVLVISNSWRSTPYSYILSAPRI